MHRNGLLSGTVLVGRIGLGLWTVENKNLDVYFWGCFDHLSGHIRKVANMFELVINFLFW